MSQCIFLSDILRIAILYYGYTDEYTNQIIEILNKREFITSVNY